MQLRIVIPALDEETELARTLPRTLAVSADVVVVDGGSRDRTVEVARNLGARVLSSEPGRGRQLNAGASLDGDFDSLLFLHADTLLPEAAHRLIGDALAGGAIGGAFAIHYDSGRAIFALGDRLANWRAAWTGWTLGDHGQFISRQAFEKLGQFRDWPLLEDLDLARRMKKLGPTVLLPAAVVTSARRFRRLGILRTVATNWLIVGLYLLGVSPLRLSRLYQSQRSAFQPETYQQKSPATP